MRTIATIIGLYAMMVFGATIIDAAQAHAGGPCGDPKSSSWMENDCARSPANDLTCDALLNHGNWQQCLYNQQQRQQGIQARQP